MTHRRMGDWTQLNRRKVFENKFFTVQDDDVIEPDGKNGRYATIDVREGVAILPLDKEGNAYLTRQFRYAIERESLEAVAGSIDGEDALAAAKREAKEELGIEAGTWTELGKINALTSICRWSTNLFLATDISFRESENESTENITPVKLYLEDAVKMVISGEITHADTCVLVMRAAAHKKVAAD